MYAVRACVLGSEPEKDMVEDVYLAAMSVEFLDV